MGEHGRAMDRPLSGGPPIGDNRRSGRESVWCGEGVGGKCGRVLRG